LWRSDEPGLARVIARMLKKNPDERWSTMASVARMLGSVGDQGGWEDPVESLVKESYRQYCAGMTAFYKDFYSRLFRISPDTEEVFAKISMRRQYRMVDEAVALLTNFRVAPEPTALSRTARSHTKLGLKEKHYRDFSAAFIETLKAAGEDDEDTLNAWRCLFRRGTEYMLHTH
jgi:hemoglobin-like flavoprotein